MRLDQARGDVLDGRLTLPGCYELCRKVQKAHDNNYSFPTRFFPRNVRPHVHALYAFLRYAREIVDATGALSPEEQCAALERLEMETVAAITGEEVLNPVLRAFSNTVRARGIKLENIAAFIDSMKMDTNVFRYRTYEELEAYTYGSAAVVGLMMCRVAGIRDDRAAPYAEALGIAVQLTNFLRDLKKDWRRGRVYLPLEDLERFDYTEEDLGNGVADERFAGLMKFEIQRARALYKVSDEGTKYIPRGRRYPVLVARRLHAGILAKIESLDYDVFNRRAENSLFEKAGVAAMCAARNPGELLIRGGRESGPEIAIPS